MFLDGNAILPKAIYRFNPFPITLPMAFSTEPEKNITVCMEISKNTNSQRNLEKENGAGGINLPDFRLYYQGIVIKTVWYWQKKHIYIDQWNKKVQRLTHTLMGTLSLTEEGRIYNREKIVPFISGAGKTGQL